MTACLESHYVTWKETQTNASLFEETLSLKTVVQKMGCFSKYNNTLSIKQNSKQFEFAEKENLVFRLSNKNQADSLSFSILMMPLACCR